MDVSTILRTRPATLCKYGNAAIVVIFSLCFFIVPAVTILIALADPALGARGIPRFAKRLHRTLTPSYAKWARQRVANQAGANMSEFSVSGTEWPLFGSVFYLLATESLQADWDANSKGTSPKVYARDAIDAAAALVMDPSHATWVRDYYGDNYLHEENCFYRMLVINAATSHEKLTRSGKYLALLHDQVETLAAEIDDSPTGWINDYPNECYPDDVLVAVAAIKKADSVLGTDHSNFIRRARRGFRDTLLDTETGLPPYSGIARHGAPLNPARGCGNSYATIFAPEIWPDMASEWYQKYEAHFWQQGAILKGFREWPRGLSKGDWYMDVDSGPVLFGYGIAASAFGIAAARSNGRFDHAAPLAAEAIAFSWPLPNGTQAAPRILSNATDAPYLGEASLLFCLTRQPVEGVMDSPPEDRVPGVVLLMLALYLLLGLTLLMLAGISVRSWRRNLNQSVRMERYQFYLWLAFILAGIQMLLMNLSMAALITFLMAQFLPRYRAASKSE